MSTNCTHCGFGRRSGPDLLCTPCRENGILRQLLAINYAGIALYHDDGELQDNRDTPFIDFKRDDAMVIVKKLELSGVKKAQEL